MQGIMTQKDYKVIDALKRLSIINSQKSFAVDEVYPLLQNWVTVKKSFTDKLGEYERQGHIIRTWSKPKGKSKVTGFVLV